MIGDGNGSPVKKDDEDQLGFIRHRFAIVDQAGQIFARRKASQKSWKWIIINTLFAVLFYIGMYVK